MLRYAVVDDFYEGAQFVCVEHTSDKYVGTYMTGITFECVVKPTQYGNISSCMLLSKNRDIVCFDVNELDTLDKKFVPVNDITDGDIMYAKLAGEWEVVTKAYDEL